MNTSAIKFIFPAILLIGLGLLYLSTSSKEVYSAANKPAIVSEVSFLEHTSSQIAVVYFGCVKCPFVCPTSLHALDRALNDLEGDFSQPVEAFFINVGPKDEKRSAEEFARIFSDNIVAVDATASERASIQQKFGIMVLDTARELERLVHTNHFFILRFNGISWEVMGRLPNDVSAEQLKIAIERAQKGENSFNLLARN